MANATTRNILTKATDSDFNLDRLTWAAFFTPFDEHPSPKFEGQIDWGARVLFWGPPGGSKTATVRALSRKMGIMFYSLKPGAKGEGAFGVTPYPFKDENGQVAFSYPPVRDYIPFLGKEAGMFFLDETNTLSKLLQAPLLGMLQEKEIGSDHFGPRIRLFGAANATEEAGGGHDLAPAVANRLCHIPFPDPPVERWNAYMLNKARTFGKKSVASIDVEAEERRVLAAWPEAYARAVGLMTAFSSAFPEKWTRESLDPHDPRASKAWTSPRTKDYATHALASSIIHDLDPNTRETFMAGYVGEPFMAEFAAFAEEQDIPPAPDVLDGRINFEHNPLRADRSAAFLAEASALVVPDSAPKRDTRAKKLFEILEDVSDDSLDAVAQVVIGSLHEAELTHKPFARSIVKKLRPFLDAIESAA